MISRDNYEIWFIDFLDGKLNNEEVKQLQRFLNENPDLKEELEGLEAVTLEPEPVSYAYKSNLKKNISEKSDFINEQSFDEICIAFFEGDLTIHQKNELENYLQSHPEKNKEFKLFEKSYLHADLSIVYERKASLKKLIIGKTIKRYIIPAASIAAAILIFLTIILYYSQGEITNKKIISEAVKDINANKTNTNNSVEKKSTTSDENNQNHFTADNNIVKNKNKKNNLVKKEIADTSLAIDNSNINNIADVEEKSDVEKLLVRKNSIPITIDPVHIMELRDIVSIIPYTAFEIKEEKPTLMQLTASQVKKLFMKQEDKINSPKITFIDFAEAAIRGFNKRTGKNIQLEKSYSESGEVDALALKSESFQIYRKIKK